LQLFKPLQASSEPVLSDVDDAERLDEADAQADVMRAVLPLVGLRHHQVDACGGKVPRAVRSDLPLDAQDPVLRVVGVDWLDV
jgi:hypothetical protein